MFDSRKSLITLERQKRSNREWLEREGTAMMREEDLKYIEENIESDLPGTRSSIADSLDRLANWHAVAGQLALIDGSLQGWNEIHRAWLYISLSKRLQFSAFQRGRVLGRFRPVESLSFEANAAALCLAYALVVRREFEMKSFGDALQVMIMDNDVVREEYWEHHSLESFTVQLYALSRGKYQSEIPTQNLGPYKPILDAWNQRSELEKAIYKACDYHCSRIEDEADDDPPEFAHPPFDLVPAEILAIYAVRQRLGLQTPNVKHPLLEPPFNLPIGDPSEIEDALLERLESRM